MRRARVTGGARLAGIVGRPVVHSLSPVIHNAWLEAAGIDAVYAAFSPEDEAGFETLVAAGRAGLLAGVNVTAPFKEQAFALADEASEAAKTAGAANILVFEAGRVRADNADGLGMLRAIRAQAPEVTLQGSPVVMLGAGGAARGAAATLVGAGARVRIVNRSRDRAEALAADLGLGVTVAEGPAAFDGAVLVVNALSVQPEIDLGLLQPGAAVMDMTYKPVVTPLLQAAREAGFATVDGLGMLIGQAGPSFEAIFGVAPPDLDPRPLLLGHLGEAA